MVVTQQVDGEFIFRTIILVMLAKKYPA